MMPMMKSSLKIFLWLISKNSRTQLICYWLVTDQFVWLFSLLKNNSISYLSYVPFSHWYILLFLSVFSPNWCLSIQTKSRLESERKKQEKILQDIHIQKQRWINRNTEQEQSRKQENKRQICRHMLEWLRTIWY